MNLVGVKFLKFCSEITLPWGHMRFHLRVPLKLWAQSVQPFGRLLDTNILTDTQSKVYILIDLSVKIVYTNWFYFKVLSMVVETSFYIFGGIFLPWRNGTLNNLFLRNKEELNSYFSYLIKHSMLQLSLLSLKHKSVNNLSYPPTL